MLRALCLAMTLLELPPGHTTDAPPEPGANAALKYWQAFATLPKFTDAEGQKLNAECLTMPLDAHARDLVTRAEYALEMLHNGAALPRCDWGLNYEEGIYTRLPHGPASRELSALACLRARLRFEEGRNAESVEDVADVMTLGRQVSLDGTLIMVLVGYSLEARSGEALAQFLPKLDPETVKGLKARLDALPPGMTPAAVMKFEEKSLLDWLVRKVKEAKGKEGVLALLTPLVALASEPEGNRGGDPAGKARAFLDECGGTAESLIQRAEELRPSFARMARTLDLPPVEFEKEFQREKARQAGNPVFRVFFAALDRVRQSQAKADVRRALLAAAIAVRLEGRGALENHPDPVAGGPFEYVPFGGGYELRSRWKADNKPVTLTVGLRGK